eukprot:gnl/MRDRNA2_/MRDRNA2_220169_c0_seq1.p1 gnl/MRDRNA2_/MRDRNA2_220169_c0~~gnl/MRDRNA2_/MRDRNA2_220169_c0_seq1.p1  ORF type:complete len:200 (+),score=51.87 gnl/MRDRNA2_/MRDRNA2_220169_c0_seq1:3-602(+)
MMSDSKVQTLLKSGEVIQDLGNDILSFGVSAAEKACVTLAKYASVCAGLTGAKESGRRLSGRLQKSSKLMVSMAVPSLEKSQKSLELAEVDDMGGVAAMEKLEVVDGDGGMSNFTDAPSYVEPEIQPEPVSSTTQSATTTKQTIEGEASSETTASPMAASTQQSSDSATTANASPDEVSFARVMQRVDGFILIGALCLL